MTTAGNLNPTPNATALTPATLAAGGADFVLTVRGSGFIPGSTVQWNGSPRLTTFVSATTLTAKIYASDIAAAGTVHVSVASPGPGGGPSAELTFAVTGGSVPPAGQLALTPSSLTFASQAVGTDSAAQAVTLQNTGQSDIHGLAIAVSGPDASKFSTTSTCSTALAASASCQVNVVFSPQSAGGASASLSVTSSASGSAQTVSLSGAASQSAFTVAPPPNGSGTTTVISGQTADYSLVLTPVAGYSGTLTLNCDGLPAHAACTFTPSSLTIANGSSANFTVTISTTDAQANGFSDPFRETGPFLGLCLLPLWWKARKPRRTVLLGMLCALLLVASTGCGGKSSSTPTPTPSALKVAPGTYTVQVLATDGVTTSKTPLSLIVQ